MKFRKPPDRRDRKDKCCEPVDGAPTVIPRSPNPPTLDRRTHPARKKFVAERRIWRRMDTWKRRNRIECDGRRPSKADRRNKCRPSTFPPQSTSSELTQCRHETAWCTLRNGLRVLGASEDSSLKHRDLPERRWRDRVKGKFISKGIKENLHEFLESLTAHVGESRVGERLRDPSKSIYSMRHRRLSKDPSDDSSPEVIQLASLGQSPTTDRGTRPWLHSFWKSSHHNLQGI